MDRLNCYFIESSALALHYYRQAKQRPVSTELVRAGLALGCVALLATLLAVVAR